MVFSLGENLNHLASVLDMAVGGGVESTAPVWAKILHVPICSCLKNGLLTKLTQSLCVFNFAM